MAKKGPNQRSRNANKYPETSKREFQINERSEYSIIDINPGSHLTYLLFICKPNTDRQTDFIDVSRHCHDSSLCHNRSNNCSTSNLVGLGGAYSFIAFSSSSIRSRSVDDHP
mmetsp:Transcript_352/g.873  ORF Transcript_352/g.873 Transcript_352/m.873 type:complete len:112 (+) Transcript_352:324-659(+)